MELPFAVEDEPHVVENNMSKHDESTGGIDINSSISDGMNPSTSAASSSVTPKHGNYLARGSSAARSHSSSTNNTLSGSSVRNVGVNNGTSLPVASPHAYQNVSITGGNTAASAVSSNASASSHGPQHGHGMNIMTNASTRSNLHRVALYDNVHPHFYTPKPLSAPLQQQQQQYNSSSRHVNSGNLRAANGNGSGHPINMEASMIRVSAPPTTPSRNHNHNQGNMQQLFSDEDFVTITADADGTYLEHYDAYNPHNPNHQVHHHDASTDHISQTRNYLSASKTSSNKYGHQMDILSLLLSSVSATSSSLVAEEKEGEGHHPDGSRSSDDSDSMMVQCETASQAATLATTYTKKGNISEAVQCHIRSANAYKQAAMLLRKDTEEGGTRSDLSFLAYSLLVLSNAQARSADCLVKHGGVRLGIGMSKAGGGDAHGGAKGKGGGRGGVGEDGSKRSSSGAAASSSTNSGHDSNKGSGGRNDANRPAGKEDRLRAKIRASLNTAEADMTDSTFLGRAVSSHSHVHVNANNPNHHRQDMGASAMASASASSKGAGTGSNPVDDMMELEQELKDMDATLNMGVNLSGSVMSTGTRRSMDGSFCVVPGGAAGNIGSSYMSSSIMWASGMSARPAVGNQQHNNNTKNRVQNHLGASMHKSPSVGGHQQLHHPHHVPAPKHHNHAGLESSWWGQASALASSTSSLSNSMVGIRSPNIGTGNHINHNAVSPANNKQVFRLLDSLKTLGDENAALLREVEEAKKSQAEARAAREAMRQFKHDYKQKFTKLKLALEKHRRENPSSNNMVSNSNFMRKTHITDMQNEIQKRDKVIQKMKAESQKKDDALRKYEKFYQQVKLRSEQKKKQKENESKK